MKLTNREKVLLPAALLIIAAALFINFIYLPLNKEIKAMKMQVMDNDIQISGEETKQKAIQSLEEKLTKVQGAFSTEHSDILEEWDQPQLMIFIEETIDPLCVKKSIDFFDMVSVQAIQAGEINVVFITDYLSFKEILQKFEEAEYYNNITLMDIHDAEMADIPQIGTTAETGIMPEEGNKEMAGDNAVAEDTTAEQENLLEVSMNIRFYAKNLNIGYPENYDFMDGEYGKTNIFQ